MRNESDHRLQRQLMVWVLLMCGAASLGAQIRLSVTLHGVHQSEVVLMPFRNGQFVQSNQYASSAQGGNTVHFDIDSADLPGEFVIRYNYRSRPEDRPYPAEQALFLSSQNVSFSVHPLYCNNADSTRFAPEEKENNLWRSFQAQKAEKLRPLQLLQELLMGYDDTHSALYRMAQTEYSLRLQQYNAWLSDMARQHSTNYVSSLFQFSRIVEVEFTGSEEQRLQAYLAAYLNGLQFDEPGLIRTAEFTNWLTNYVNAHAQTAHTQAQLDSVLRSAATRMIETVRDGHPLVYGYVVDYFFDGFERNNMQASISILEPYLQDPNCLTRKRQAIQKRLSGLNNLKPGVKAPAIQVENSDAEPLHVVFDQKGYDQPVLLFFYYSDCGHCTDLLRELNAWYRTPENAGRLRVVSVSVDDDQQRWKAYSKASAFGWLDAYAPGGVNSEAAADYYVLSTPALFLIKSDGTLVDMPSTMYELENLLDK